MIAPSSSSPADQLALIGDRMECLKELSEPIIASDGNTEITDCLGSFVVINLLNNLKGAHK